jgi:lipopolysaccharide export system protein LptC
LSLNNVNKQMLRDNNPNRRRNNETDVTQENRSITMDTRVKFTRDSLQVK